ncbi:serine/threonine-protein kinase [Sphingomonas naasensis]|uniref:non-specific serine/threonine protein kinase n=1 Tax=Sphingomonas naasensis TaxID=1344951 RepID=A0A4S1W973_9SPHN|nr:serine/threonine-protein kinase [Sphingomonas naasensis]NIJ19590.1 serine/threonine-protein kinase [Sphingomonas naasensis]TGX39318.1 serine/threonine protein kinase [Sphingomonas naasensis]
MEKLGRYRIEARLGEGAMADVFRAHDPDIGRTVAIKALKPDYRRDPELGARFLREARAAGALNHPNIATIYDVGEADGVPYIAMELIEGRPLDAVLQAQGRMPFERVLALGIQLADALAYAHGQGIVHRDVKPSNILLSADGGTAKLLDFGVARIGDAEGQLARTQAGQMIGTPRYMSPEQALGLPVDARSDLFSLGAVLYEMVTGKMAFDATGLATLALQIAQERVAPIERAAGDCPPGLRQIVDKLLAKKPDQRFADGAQLVQVLRRESAALATEDAVTRRGLSLRVKLPLALVSITLVALLLSISTILSRQQRALEHMAIASGETIATFVTKNAAVLLADNAGLPPEQQDWTPLQAFVTAASQDGGVRGMVVVDAGGTIRAASDGGRVGQRYAAPSGEPALSDAVTNARDARGGALRFVRPIRYAGADFGKVDILLPRTALDAAMANARTLMIALATIVMLVVLAIGYLSGAMVVRPLRRLLTSFDEAREQGFALRISHRRRDEIGALFDGFNRLAAEIEPRLHGAPAAEEVALDATCIQPAPRRAA